MSWMLWTVATSFVTMTRLAFTSLYVFDHSAHLSFTSIFTAGS